MSRNGLFHVETIGLAKRGIFEMYVRTVKAQDSTAVYREMKDGRVTGRVVIDGR